jgi:glycosyltransferase involved in cell wall biosynthesis
VAKTHPEWILTIVGSCDDVAEVKKLKRLIKSLNLSTVQLFPPSNDIIYYYVNSSFFVLSSRYEGMPLTLLEAMSCGLPCVAFDCLCGPRDIIADGKDGLLVPNGNIAELAEAIRRLLEDKALRNTLGEAAVLKSQQFSLPTIMAQWDKLFKQVKSKE